MVQKGAGPSCSLPPVTHLAIAQFRDQMGMVLFLPTLLESSTCPEGLLRHEDTGKAGFSAVLNINLVFMAVSSPDIGALASVYQLYP